MLNYHLQTSIAHLTTMKVDSFPRPLKVVVIKIPQQIRQFYTARWSVYGMWNLSAFFFHTGRQYVDTNYGIWQLGWLVYCWHLWKWVAWQCLMTSSRTLSFIVFPAAAVGEHHTCKGIPPRIMTYMLGGIKMSDLSWMETVCSKLNQNAQTPAR